MLDKTGAETAVIGLEETMTGSPRTEWAVARCLADTADPRDAVACALEAIGESLGWRVGAVWEPVGDRREALRCVQTWSATDAAAREFEALSHGIALASGEGLPGRVWQSEEPAWIPDVVTDGNFPRAQAARRAGLHAAFCFPIRSASGVLGVIEFFAGEACELDAELLATMSALGDQIGQAVERRRDADALRAKEARHRTMLDAALDCVVTIDHEGRVVDFNPAAERTFGYRAEEAVGREMAELIVPPDLRERHRQGLARYLATETPVLLDRRVEITAMRADGSTFPVELTITRIDLPGPPMFTGYLRDITERKAAEAELRASRTRIVEAADAARRRLERDLHDGAQQRLVELALDLRMARARLDDDPARAREYLDAALADLKQATAELRELARGIHPAALTEGGLRPALEALVARSSVPVRLVAVPDKRFAAPVEATAYFTVAEGLTNACRYAAARRVEVEARQLDGRLRVEVRDDGQGGADPAAGTGLRGLAARVAALDGRMQVSGPASGGTVLRVEIPCAS
jgi:PAS domain S-box-containing protein